jgi:FkbM family methyltransferase
MNKKLSVWTRVGFLRRTMKNWPLIFADKAGLRPLLLYRTRTGLSVWCRARSTDINEAVAVLAGLEYPFHYGKLNNGAYVIDAGANIGSFILLLHLLNPCIRFSGVAIEPFDETLTVLRRNLQGNEIEGFALVEGVVNDIDGSVRIRTDLNPDAVRISCGGSGINVSSFRLSTYCRRHDVQRVDLLKMDVEGAEYRIIESDYDFLRDHVARVLIECHDWEGRGGLHWVMSRLEEDFAIDVIHSRGTTGVIHGRNKWLLSKQ